MTSSLTSSFFAIPIPSSAKFLSHVQMCAPPTYITRPVKEKSATASSPSPVMSLATASSPSSMLLLILLLPLLALPSPAAAQGYRNVSLGSSLTTQGITSWLSPSGDFAFGFLPATLGATDNFLLAIWFAKIPDKTPVWFLRKGGAPPSLQAGSRVDLTNDGFLVLSDHTGNKPWTIAGVSASYAAMLDNGNFVLVSSSGEYRWQSFANPTDTILPTQQLPLGTDLVARLMDTDYTNGRFKLAVQADGKVLFPIPLSNPNQYKPYWEFTTASADVSNLIFDTSGNVYLTYPNGTIASNITSGKATTSEFYQRATLEPNGLFRHYLYPKNLTVGSAWSFSQQIPADICRDLLTIDVGSGACGYNALCTTVDRTPMCSCPEGYSFLDPEREYMGCKPDFMPQSCSSAGGDPAGYLMLPMQDADWPWQDYEYLVDVDEHTCSDGCLNDCFCAAAIYSGNRGCWKKKQPLANGRVGSYVGNKALLKISRNISNAGSQLRDRLMNQKKQNRGIPILLGVLIISSLIFIILVLVARLLVWTPQRRIGEYEQQQQQQKQSDLSMLDSSMRRFTYKELEKSTGGFKEELGRGAFGVVYKGVFSDEVQIAVKKLDKVNLKEEQAEKEFLAEIKAIGRTHHKNLVRLLGYCNEGSHRMLVYEFLSNGSLTSFISGAVVAPKSIGWVQRAKIAYGIARGLFYLHEECAKQIIHCDIKPQNVLLDEHLNPKISDFGMAKLLGSDQTRTATGIRGTRGYVAPEWFKPEPVSTKVDVYSFGVMLLEIVCCKRAVEPVYREDSEEPESEILIYWVYDCYKEGRVDLLVSDDLEAMADLNSVQRFVMIALWCIQDDPASRPSMKKVTQMLEGEIEVSVPPDPSAFFSRVA